LPTIVILKKDFALANISLTECSLNPDEHERPAWADRDTTYKTYAGKNGVKHGTYFEGNLAREEREMKKLRAEQAATVAPINNPISIKPISTKRPIAWTTQKTHPNQHAQTHHQANNAAAWDAAAPSTPPPYRPTTRQTTRSTATTRSTTRPTLPSDWGIQTPAFP